MKLAIAEITPFARHEACTVVLLRAMDEGLTQGRVPHALGGKTAAFKFKVGAWECTGRFDDAINPLVDGEWCVSLTVGDHWGSRPRLGCFRMAIGSPFGRRVSMRRAGLSISSR